MIACGGTDEVGEDNATSSSHRCAIIVVAVKWRWSYPHPIALWVTRRARARARASLTSLSLSSLLCRGGDDGRQCSHLRGEGVWRDEARARPRRRRPWC